MAELALRNNTSLVFTDISSEAWRSYISSDGKAWYTIQNPQWLSVSDSGGHRVLDAAGICHYVQPHSCFAIRWQVKEGQPHFVR